MSPRVLPRAELVILLHGLARTSRSLKSMQRFLESHGYHVCNLDYPSRHHSIADLCQYHVAPQFQQLQSQFPNAKMHFVTHSMGGILLRYYLARQQLANMGRVVMLSPPNQGSELVDRLCGVPGFALLNGPAGMELGTDAQSVPQQLPPVDFELGVITGHRSVNLILSLFLQNANDGKVSESRARVQGMRDFRSVPHSHPFIMNAKIVQELVLRFLQNGQF